jgi:predicted nucleotidyltransferase component of viral defense system
MMNEAVARMLARYESRTVDDRIQALREILQEIALLGLWRSKFFEKAAFYGGTSLRLLYGLDRFSEDLDFSLLEPARDFDLRRYSEALEREINAFGFHVRLEKKEKTADSQIQSAFLKADTVKHLMVIETAEPLLRKIPHGQMIKIRLEVDTDPPSGFETENKFLLHPIPFAVRTYVLPDLFAGKMHAVLCRKWKNRVKGRDWYDLVWYAANHPQLHAAHLAQRMMQSGHLKPGVPLTRKLFLSLANAAVDQLNVSMAKKEVEPFIKNPEALNAWSPEFFRDILQRIILV